jgi:undecaprenyl diphosphate synthase
MPSRTDRSAQTATDADTSESASGLTLPAEALPKHIAVIMDGNGRWAKRRGQPRIYGHQQGAKAVRGIVTECARLKLEVLTLYSFSLENWKRPADEVNALMGLYVEYLAAECPTMMENDVRFVQVGRREGLNPRVLDAMDRTRDLTSGNGGLTLALALNYGARAELTDATRSIAKQVQAGELDPDDIDEHTISAHLYTADLRDPDLLIRTAGEMRVSNYLLWQISYAELYIAEVCWPDFNLHELHKSLYAYAARKRKFGALQ